ncbi:MAG: FAD-dependent oxidoreductase [Kiritimatiellia bacterium]
MGKSVLFGAIAACGLSAAAAEVVVVGGTEAGVTAALAAKAAGADVILYESRPALGSDTAGKLLLAPGETPLTIRKALDERLLSAGVDFRTWTYVKDVLRDSEGRVAAVTIVNRSGEKTVPARCVVDATERAYVAKRAGGRFAEFPAGEYAFSRIVVSGQRPSSAGMDAVELASLGPVRIGKPKASGEAEVVTGRVWRCAMRLPMADGSALAFARAEQLARDRTWTAWQLEGADTCVFDAPDRLIEDAPGVITCGPLARTDARLAGERAAAFAAQARPGRPTRLVPAEQTADSKIVVVGMGTGGAPAAIAAARSGWRTAVFEYAYRAGGLTTEGMIGSYWYGNRVGFTAEIDREVPKTGLVYSQAKEQWFRSEAVRAGAEVLFGSFVYGVEKKDGRIVAVKAMLADGAPLRMAAGAVVDATGNCDVAAAAGEETEFIGAEELSLQGAAFVRKALGSSYLNLDWTFVNDTDAEDLWYLSLRGRRSYENDGRFWDQAQTVDSRERRRLVGRVRVTAQDVMLARTYPDIVCITRSNFDTHGQTVDPQFFIESPPHEPISVNLPYRALLPRQTSNLIVIGLGLSAQRDAMPILRMQPDVQNQGWVAGLASARALSEGVALADIDVKALQRDLVAKRILPEWALTAEDSFPLPDARIDAAVGSLTNNYAGLAVVFAEPSRAVPRLECAYRAASAPAARLVYAHVLAFLGSPLGAETLAAKLKGAAWDKGWNYRGMGQFKRSVSWIDSYVLALGATRADCAFEPLAALAGKLSPQDYYSHFRALSRAFEALGDARGAAVLAKALAMPGVGGHAFDYSRDGVPPVPEYDVYNFQSKHPLCRKASSVPDGERTACLVELSLARAIYRLGDCDGVGERTLRAYARDPRRAYAEHAAKVLGQAR